MPLSPSQRRARGTPTNHGIRGRTSPDGSSLHRKTTSSPNVGANLVTGTAGSGSGTSISGGETPRGSVTLPTSSFMLGSSGPDSAPEPDGSFTLGTPHIVPTISGMYRVLVLQPSVTETVSVRSLGALSCNMFGYHRGQMGLPLCPASPSQ